MLHELELLLPAILGWADDFLPDVQDSPRCFEFLSLCRTAAQLSSAQGKGVAVVAGPSGTFAGAPGNRLNHNYLVCGEYRLYFGVGFIGSNSQVWHHPDVAIVHQSDVTRPIAVTECKYWTTSGLPKSQVMAFVGLLHDLRMAMFSGCRKAAVPQANIATLSGVARDEIVCSLLSFCRSRMMVTAKPSAPMMSIAASQDFEIILEAL